MGSPVFASAEELADLEETQILSCISQNEPIMKTARAPYQATSSETTEGPGEGARIKHCGHNPRLPQLPPPPVASPSPVEVGGR